MELHSIRYFRFWVVLALMCAVLAGIEIAVMVTYLRRHLDLLDLRHMNAPIGAATMLVAALSVAVRLVNCYRDALSAVHQRT